MIAEGQLEGYESYWQQANIRNFAYLPYKPLTSGGVQVPPPQRLAVEPAVQAITSVAPDGGRGHESRRGALRCLAGATRQ